VSWVETYSGVHFDLANPDAALVRLVDVAHALAHANRFAGHATTGYPVAQHSVYVRDRVAERIPDSMPRREAARLVFAALLHDCAETYVGDSIGPVKQLCPDIVELEDRVLRVVAPALGADYDLITTHPYIAEADHRALLTEAQWLVGEPGILTDRWWGLYPDLEPYDPDLAPEPVSAARAERTFLQAFYELQGAL
jgi:hypothetical protein